MSDGRSNNLTRYNPFLSGPITRGLGVERVSAINCTEGLGDDVASFVRDSLAPSTRTAYLSDIRHFETWGGQIPAAPKTIAAYLAAHADMLSVATLVRRAASVS